MKSSEKTGRHSRTLIAALPWAWLLVVAFSQTSLAGRLADELFAWAFGPDEGAQDESLHWLLQKGYHVFQFATFGALLALPAAARPLNRCLLWASAVGLLAEALQLFAAGRSPHVSDAGLNVVAGSLAVAAVASTRRGFCR